MTVNAGAQQNDPKRTNPERSRGDAPKAVAPEDQRVTGVIVRAEPISGDPKSSSNTKNAATESRRPAAQLLTIQTTIDWNEWARDQVGAKGKATPREEAEKGANSVATKGQPRSKNTDVVVDIGPNTTLASRSRTDLGDVPGESASTSTSTSTRANPRYKDSESTQFRVEDLKPGLFVEINFARKDGRNVASTMTVIHPVGHVNEVVDPARSPSAKQRRR